ncbi:hypothetical protein L6452_40724 [Arctium lappa]|uniref:Uncharacterized protein n=1 Tax=Arctium lappa TaxID=4217 RepID=A0ACB8XM57_ARCLA|nr:hypothetical protein L6452_40724 [Arctium lappa]
MADERGGEDIDEKILKVGGGGEIIDADEDVEGKDSSGDDVLIADQISTGEVRDGEDGATVIDIKAQAAPPNLPRFEYSWGETYTDIFNKVREERDRFFPEKSERVGSLDIRRDKNILDYFKVTPFNLHGDDNLKGIASYGGGGRTRRLSVENVANNDRRGGGEVVVERLDSKTAITVVGAGASKKPTGDEKGSVQRPRWWKKCWRAYL